MSYSSRHNIKQSALSVPRLRHQQRIPLSLAMNQNPRACDERKITLVDKAIASIDAVARRFQGVEVLFLSTNFVKDLGLIGQFPALKSLSLPHNFLDRLTLLLPLHDLKALEMVNFEDNPIVHLPTYRDFLLDLVPSIQSLDSRDVSEQDHFQAKANIKQLDRVIDLMTGNEEEGTKLEQLHFRLLVHQELIYKGLINSPPNLAIPSLMRWVRLDWPTHLKLQIRDNFEETAKLTVRRNPSKDWLWAYSQGLMDQQQVIAELMLLCERDSKDALTMYLSKTTPVKSSRLKKTATTSVFSIQSDLSTTPQLRKTISFTESPRPFSLTARPADLPELDGNSRVSLSQNTGTERTGPDFIQQIHSENQVLRKTLIDYERENQVKEAESEELVRKLMNQVEELSGKVAESEREQSRYENKLSIAIARTAVLEARNALSQAVPEVQFPGNPAKMEFQLIAAGVRNSWLKSIALTQWKAHHSTVQNKKMLEEKVRKRLDSELEEVTWGMWRAALAASTQYRFQEQLRVKTYASAFFKSWKKSQRRQKRANRILLRTMQRTLATTFTSLKTYPLLKSQTRAKKALAQSCYSSRMFLKVWVGWKKSTESWNIEEGELKEMEEKAGKWNVFRVRKNAWGRWIEWRVQIGRKRHLDVQKAQTHSKQRLQRSLLSLLVTNKYSTFQLSSEASVFREKNLYVRAATWLKLAKMQVSMRKVKTHMRNLASTHRRKEVFATLRRGIGLSTNAKKSMEFAKVANKVLICRRTLKAWNQVSSHLRKVKQEEALLLTRIKLRRTREFLMKWNFALLHPAHVQEKADKTFIKTILNLWLNHTRYKAVKRYRATIGQRLYIRKQKDKFKQVFSCLRKYGISRTRDSLLDEKVKSSLAFRSKLLIYTQWKSLYSRSLLVRAELKLVEAQKEQRLNLLHHSEKADLSTECKELKQVVSVKEGELSSLQDSLTATQDTLLTLESSLKHSESQIQELTSALETEKQHHLTDQQAANQLISTYETELKDARNQLEVQRQELDQKGKSLKQTYQDFARLEETSKSQLRELESTAEQLKFELRNQEAGIRNTELISESLKSHLEKAQKVLNGDMSNKTRGTDSSPNLGSPWTNSQARHSQSLRTSVVAFREQEIEASNQPEATEKALKDLQTEQAKIRERLIARTQSLRNMGKLMSGQPSPRLPNDT